MSTQDVPGANPANGDELTMGCWAEHEDGSLIFVESTEADRVVYSIFDLSVDPPLEYRDAMPRHGFERAFSYPTETGDKWTWHDKTPFPWERIMDDFQPGSRPASAVAQLSAAARVAKHLDLKAGEISPSVWGRAAGAAGSRARQVMDKFRRALGEFRQ